MLRKSLYIIGILLLLLAFAAAVAGVLFAFWWQLLLAGVILVGGLAFERWQYKPLGSARPEQGWTDTGERFVDPQSGRLAGVWFDPRNGKRHYLLLDEGDSAPGGGTGT